MKALKLARAVAQHIPPIYIILHTDYKYTDSLTLQRLCLFKSQTLPVAKSVYLNKGRYLDFYCCYLDLYFSKILNKALTEISSATTDFIGHRTVILSLRR